MIKKIILLLAIALPLSGCTINNDKVGIKPLKYYRYQGYNLKKIGRVLILEMNNFSDNPKLSDELTTALSEEIQKKQIFGLETLYYSDPKWKSLSIQSGSDFSLQQLSDIQTKFEVGAVLYGKIMHYRPYPRNSIGLKLKLVDCATGQLLWAVDQVWDSTDASTEEKVKSFFRNQMRSGYDPADWKMVLLSPRLYNKFITFEIAQTFESKDFKD